MYVATKHNLATKSYSPNDFIDEDFMLISKGHKVLIVGHSNTTPMIANKLLGEDKYNDMDDNDNSSLYVVKVNGKAKKSEIRKVEL
jgi:hypothetical protein